MYQRIKAELLRRCENPRYFTRAFLNAFESASRRFQFLRESGIDDSYYSGHVRLFHSMDPVYNSEFYRLNGSAYCEFLEIYHSMKKEGFTA